ncbi:MAG: DUF1543 domain-containing protein [Daejeonella sp.]
MSEYKLYMILIGCTPDGRNTEQHDMFFTIAKNMKDLLPQIEAFWPEAKGEMHVDAWREVNRVGNYKVNVIPRTESSADTNVNLFFINLGGYKKDEFDEFHYKIIVAAENKADAIKQAKETAFYKHVTFEGAKSHIDDKFGVDVDNIHQIGDILPKSIKSEFSISLETTIEKIDDEIHLGYFKLSSFR